MKNCINSKNAPTPIGPYSHAVKTGNMLFVSGQVGVNSSNNKLAGPDIQSEARQVMENIKAILAEAGMNFTHVVKCSIFLRDMNDFKAVNEIYGSYFTAEFPARETVQVSGLPLNVNVEISAIAVKE